MNQKKLRRVSLRLNQGQNSPILSWSSSILQNSVLRDRIPIRTVTATEKGRTELAGKYRRTPLPMPTASTPLVIKARVPASQMITGTRYRAVSAAAVSWPPSAHSEKKIAEKASIAPPRPVAGAKARRRSPRSRHSTAAVRKNVQALKQASIFGGMSPII